MDFDYHDWAPYREEDPIWCHHAARLKFTKLLQKQTRVFDRAHFTVSVDPMRVVTVPGTLNAATGLVCRYIGTRKDLEKLTIQELLEKSKEYDRFHGYPETLESSVSNESPNGSMKSCARGSGKKTATLLRLLKETAMRLGEAWLVEWTDVDIQNRMVTCTNPEKNSRSRAFTISGELCQMLESLPHNSQYIFSCNREPLVKEDRRTHLHHLKRQKGLLGHQRRRIAEKLKNPRIAKIKYHSLRHWKATQLYHQTKDILYVMKFLGHRDVKNTLLYIDLESVCFSKGGENYHAKTARTETEALQLIEAGFEYVCSIGEAQLFRERK
jgi:integrase